MDPRTPRRSWVRAARRGSFRRKTKVVMSGADFGSCRPPSKGTMIFMLTSTRAGKLGVCDVGCAAASGRALGRCAGGSPQQQSPPPPLPLPPACGGAPWNTGTPWTSARFGKAACFFLRWCVESLGTKCLGQSAWSERHHGMFRRSDQPSGALVLPESLSHGAQRHHRMFADFPSGVTIAPPPQAGPEWHAGCNGIARGLGRNWVVIGPILAHSGAKSAKPEATPETTRSW